MKNPNDIIVGYLTDMAGVEKHIAEAVERQINTDKIAQFPEALQLLQRLHSTLTAHVEAIEAHVGVREGGDLKEKAKEALGTALGIAAGLYNKIREDKVSRMVRDTYTATSLACVSYHMLHTTALGLKEDIVADMAVSHLKDLTPILVDLSKVVCHVVAKELADEGKVIDAAVAGQAVSNTQEAWSGNYVN